MSGETFAQQAPRPSGQSGKSGPIPNPNARIPTDNIHIFYDQAKVGTVAFQTFINEHSPDLAETVKSFGTNLENVLHLFNRASRESRVGHRLMNLCSERVHKMSVMINQHSALRDIYDLTIRQETASRVHEWLEEYHTIGKEIPPRQDHPASFDTVRPGMRRFRRPAWLEGAWVTEPLRKSTWVAWFLDLGLTL